MQIIIFLNGTSSAGKSSIAEKLRESSGHPYLHVKLDTFLRMVKSDYFYDDEVVEAIVQGFHNSLYGLAAAKNSIIIDHVFQGEEWLPACIAALAEFRVYFFGIHCELETLMKREAERGNRLIGTAAFQYDIVHRDAIYDLLIDTDANDVETCARVISDFIDKTPDPAGWIKTAQLLKDKYDRK
ncbi:chloramphenicol phosphotransferase CPT family protein [Flavobacterium sp. 3HN19-14]|uniref:chloramphenicol phosphotransferase CPT family protein n=1 Tax=Flavobacterium sp. 3HN19-14 TaxID=3448133 RepID=UPI003EE20A50